MAAPAAPTAPRAGRRPGVVRNPQQLLPTWLQRTVIVVLLLSMAPVAYMALISVSPDVEVGAGQLWPSRLVLSNYVAVWSSIDLATGLVNSLVASLAAGVIATVFGLGAAYCLARLDFRGRGPFLNALVGFQIIPGTMIILPLFVVFSSVGAAIGVPLIGQRPTLIVTYLTFAIPFATWLLVTNLRQIPTSFEEAAMIDGLNRFGVLRKIIFPLMLPGMLVTVVFSMLVGWNDVLFANVLTNPQTHTVAIQLQAFGSATETGALPLYGQLMAASLISSAPVVLLYMIFQRQLVGGLAAGGEKG
ncbi:carbohydrate ABC transporter membrane protein 2, CUT1 family [Quadrisphaera granulorum]|uniref:Carbohydrate ABC transporter membrane protein 2 (CUT1 family) n=1 Tax=Quadrisphaera granulorum TaxID=317664 RepID=A0A316AA61_9ACTN|nr:carbohydrate ABC transporter permease [Quadrisphaera granulorum]PWJ54422.1 carbohydrate ABC transporter membrane protein 2 (CUT1 family) [Quadrisphaera granulorum]SZE96194.1 carbohydrate ABC transporter membrane protein 2, CUT1 family [Quadrisphaera granulorum]